MWKAMFWLISIGHGSFKKSFVQELNISPHLLSFIPVQFDEIVDVRQFRGLVFVALSIRLLAPNRFGKAGQNARPQSQPATQVQVIFLKLICV